MDWNSQDSPGSRNGHAGMNGYGSSLADAIVLERRFLRLETSHIDQERRLGTLERTQQDIERGNLRRDRDIEKLKTAARGSRDKASPPPSANAQMIAPILMQVARSAGQWIGGLLAMRYVLNGGDALTALQSLAKLF